MGSPLPAPPDPAENFDSPTFLAASQELLTSPSDAAVTRFLRTFSLATVLWALQCSTDADVIRASLACLRCIVASDAAVGELLAFVPALEQGLSSPLEEVRAVSCLAVHRIGRLSSSEKMREALQAARQLLTNQVVLRGLLTCLADPSTALAASASDAIWSLCCSFPAASELFFAGPALLQLRSMLSQPPVTTQQRTVSLCIRLAAESGAAAAAVKQVGVVEELLDMIGGKGFSIAAAASLQSPGRADSAVPVAPVDELAALTACELLTDFVRQPGSARLLCENALVSRALLHVLRRTANPAQAAGSVLVRAAWKAAAYLVSPPSPGVPSPLTPAEAKDFADCLSLLCLNLAGALGLAVGANSIGDVTMAEAEAPADSASFDTTEMEEALYEASSIMCATVQGARLLLGQGLKHVVLFAGKRAFGALPRRHATPDLQLAALYLLASLLGSERAGESGRFIHSAPPIAAPPENLELGDDAEATLREQMYYAAVGAPQGPALGSVLLSLLKQEEAVRMAVYRLVAVLVEREWGVGEVCGSSKLVDNLVDPLTESNKEAMDWRHTCVVAAASAAAAHASASSSSRSGEHFSTRIGAETVKKLEAAARLGPYAVQRMVEARPVVAVEERPPAGI